MIDKYTGGDCVKTNSKGFTLIEMMVVVAIMGILYSVALPAYSQYVQDGRRADIQQEMLQQVAHLERQYTRLGGYPDTSVIPTTDYYSFSYAPSVAAAATPGIENDSRTFLLTAIPKSNSSQSNDKCGSMSINHQGLTTANVSQCWK